MSSFYPMRQEQVHFRHQGGTKGYYLTSITNAQGDGILIRRWGKLGRESSIKVEVFAAKQRDRVLLGAFKERERKGYREEKPQAQTLTHSADLFNAIGRIYFPKIGKEAIEHLDPNYDTSGMKSTVDPDFDEDGNRVVKSARPAFTPEQLEEAKLQAEREAQAAKMAAYKSHPLFGRF
jgi:predicted DNA-binding WGR domain protein